MTREKQNWSDIWDNFAQTDILDKTVANLALDADCAQTLEQAQRVIFSDPTAAQAVLLAAKALFADLETQIQSQLKIAAEATGICYCTCAALMLIHSIPAMELLYQEKGLSRQLMWDTLIDLKCKLVENHAVDGIWGTGAVGWYIRLFNGRIIKLGRLEFEPIGYKWDTPYRGICKGDPVMNMHIPSTGPMKLEDVLDSFCQAYRFYGYTEPMPVAAASWLLYPPVCEATMKPGSNLRNFYELFDLVEQYEDPANHNFWRIFNMEYEEGILEKVPQDTSLRRALYEYMKPGRNMGVGRCMLLFDGEKVIRK